MTATVVPNRSLLDKQVADTMADASGYPVGLCRIPDLDPTWFDDEGKLVRPYGVVYPRPGHLTTGSLADDSWMAQYPYQVTWVGQTDEQAQFAAEKCRQGILHRNGNGAYANPITTADAVALLVTLEEVGGPEPGGEGLRQVVDIFNLEVDAIG